MDYIIFPSDYFDGKQVETEYLSEYQACQAYTQTIIFNYEKFFEENKLILNQLNLKPGKAVYRGWMMTPKQYQSFYSQLRDKYQIELFTSPEQYEQFHLFPNIYPELIEDTPKMLTFPLGTKVDIEKIRSQMSEFMIKDYVKSAKGTELPIRISSAISQQQLDEYLEIFYRYRGDLLTGGICIKEYVEAKPNATYTEGARPWSIKCDIALPCATQNELDLDDAKALVANGVFAVCEGANMPTTPDAIHYLMNNGVFYAPGKASNAGGVACSGLEMSQNAQHLSWTAEEVDEKLEGIMVNIFNTCRDTAKEYGHEKEYVVGANIASFLKVAEAMKAQGTV